MKLTILERTVGKLDDVAGAKSKVEEVSEQQDPASRVLHEVTCHMMTMTTMVVKITRTLIPITTSCSFSTNIFSSAWQHLFQIEKLLPAAHASAWLSNSEIFWSLSNASSTLTLIMSTISST
jgi:hypothetical protein